MPLQTPFSFAGMIRGDVSKMHLWKVIELMTGYDGYCIFSHWGLHTSLSWSISFSFAVYPKQAGLSGSSHSATFSNSPLHTHTRAHTHWTPPSEAGSFYNYGFSSLLLLWFHRVPCSPGCSLSCHLVEAGLEHLILLSPPPTSWDYRHAPPCPAIIMFWNSVF